MKDVPKPPLQRTTRARKRSTRWVRPELIRFAIQVLRLIDSVAKLIDHWLR